MRKTRSIASVTVAVTLVAASSAFMVGCVTYIPVDEYSLARASYEAAKDADAARFAPALWFDAELDYRDAQKLFKERHYEECRDKFVQARVLAEQAENVSRLARHQSGEIIP
jgi:hypothetical protein